MKTLRNYFYSASYQLLTILLPIITVPIISRALGSTGVGVYAYTNSIVQEFTLVGTLGVSNYAVRQIAYVRDDKDLQILITHKKMNTPPASWDPPWWEADWWAS